VAPPSCNALAVNCGLNDNESCCTSLRSVGGSFNRDNSTSYPARVADFLLDKYEITVGRFRKFVAAYPASKPRAGAGAHPLINGSGWNTAWDSALPADQASLMTRLRCAPSSSATWTDTAGGGETRPVNCLSWYLAFAFCAWDGGRLPTELEWNYAAAGGGEQRLYPWGGSPPSLANTDLAIWNCRYSTSDPTCPTTAYCCTGTMNIASVGSAVAGNGRWGHADLAGNLSEWVLDWYEAYPNSCTNCATLAGGSSRSVRGGAFVSNGESFIRTSARSNSDPTNLHSNNGARCARAP
jgi:formylglycine-generating enzyme required for sulfatase activity